MAQHSINRLNIKRALRTLSDQQRNTLEKDIIFAVGIGLEERREMITLTIVEHVKTGKKNEIKRSIQLFNSVDKAKQFIGPVVKEMQQAKKEKREPKIRIDGVSYDSNSEKTLLMEMKAITSVDNEDY